MVMMHWRAVFLMRDIKWCLAILQCGQNMTLWQLIQWRREPENVVNRDRFSDHSFCKRPRDETVEPLLLTPDGQICLAFGL